MKSYKSPAVYLVIFILKALLLCSCNSGFFRDRNFDYSRNKVYEENDLKIPKTIENKPDFHSKLIIPEYEGKIFSDDGYLLSQSSLLPPKFDQVYSINYIRQKQYSTVQTKIIDNFENKSLIIYEPYLVSFMIIKDTLQSLEDFELIKIDLPKQRFFVLDKKSNKKYYIFLAKINDDFGKTELSLFSEDKKRSKPDISLRIIHIIDRSIVGKKISQRDLVNSQFGFISTKKGLKFQLYSNSKIIALVLTGNLVNAREIILSTLEKSGYRLIESNKESLNIESPKGQKYFLYFYQYLQNGDLFSDLSNWNNFFRNQKEQLRIAVFDTNKLLLTSNEARNILLNIASNIPLKNN